MRLTGKCKEDFKKWLIGFGTGNILIPYNALTSFPKSMQYGVYTDFFTHKGIRPSIIDKWPIYNIQFSLYEGDLIYVKFETENLQEARTAAVKKANEIYNLN